MLTGEGPGRCISGSCAYPNPACESGYQYGPSADALSETCVGAEAEGTTGFDGSGPGDSSSSSEGTGEGCPAHCTTPPSACFESVGLCDPVSGACVYAPHPKGTPCGGIDDPCFAEGTCDGEGSCTGEPVVCDAPPGPCHAATGTCDPATGACSYAPLPEGSECSDGNDCTVGDLCDGRGGCMPGPVCPSTNPCEDAACEGGLCVYEPLADGSACGPLAADRCCGGTCVDISSDDAHCGGCFAACVQAHSCESIAVTNMCSSSPPDTTGRCTCTANAECPLGQICRTFTPYPGRCAPEGVGACAGEFFPLSGCPNYCGY
jgi:hypothetical protein